MQSSAETSLLLEAEEAEKILSADMTKPILIDLGKTETYLQAHLPGAIHIEYKYLIHGVAPALGLLPDKLRLENLFAAIRLKTDSMVIAYDDEGGGRAARLLWTLDVIGHKNIQVINGGIHAWQYSGFPLETAPAAKPEPSAVEITINPDYLATKEEILTKLGDPDVILLDARTIEEFRGEKAFAARGGRIPGAVNLNWLDTLDMQRQTRLKPNSELRAMLEQRGVTPDKEIITYCQTHHRSSHAYMMLKHLGYTQIKGYAGSWSEWGNDPTTPVETG